MSQATAWGVPLVGPATPSVYAQRDQDSFNALLSCHRGSSRPIYAVAGTIWCKTIDATEEQVYLYDGTSDIYIGKLDLTNHLFWTVVSGTVLTATGDEINNACDGITATAAEINKKTSEQFVNAADGGAYVSSTTFLVAANIGAAWESIGPTASGATNIWTALNGVPSDVDWIEVRIEQLLERTSGADSQVSVSIYARQNGSAVSASLETKIFYVSGYGGTTIGVETGGTVTHKIPVSSRMFDMYYSAAGYTSQGCWMTLIGYGYNP